MSLVWVALWVVLGAVVSGQFVPPPPHLPRVYLPPMPRTKFFDDSAFITLTDGVRIAVDVAVPLQSNQSTRVPTLVRQTRYYRTPVVWNETHIMEQRFTEHALWEVEGIDSGYAVVVVDIRGTGASFGTHRTEFDPRDTEDLKEVLDWIVTQRWSDGRTAVGGLSYEGTTAEFAVRLNHPSLKAAVVNHDNWDVYKQLVFPGGLRSDTFLSGWSGVVSALDRGLIPRRSSRPVQWDWKSVEGAYLQHYSNPAVVDLLGNITAKDQRLPNDPWSFVELSPYTYTHNITSSKVPFFITCSYLDSAAVDAAFLRYLTYTDNPQYVYVLATNHGSKLLADPFVVGAGPCPPAYPTVESQIINTMTFLDHYLYHRGTGPGPVGFHYYTLNTPNRLRHTTTWPPSHITHHTLLYMGAGKTLSTTVPIDSGVDEYTVDFGVTTGNDTRWRTPLDSRCVQGLADRGAMDARMLTYTSAPLPTHTEVSGRPILRLRASSSTPDGYLIVYLEAVEPSGRSVYLTEGNLRLLHHKISDSPPPYPQTTPYHSFLKEDENPMTPGLVGPLDLELWPVSARLEKGSRLRVAIAGADADNFTPLVTSAAFHLSWGPETLSFISIPSDQPLYL